MATTTSSCLGVRFIVEIPCIAECSASVWEYINLTNSWCQVARHKWIQGHVNSHLGSPATERLIGFLMVPRDPDSETYRSPAQPAQPLRIRGTLFRRFRSRQLK